MRALAGILGAIGLGLLCLSGGVAPPHFKIAHAQVGPLVGTGPMAPTCPSPYGGNNSQTVSLLHMDGANGATSVTDYAYGAGASPLSWTFGSGASLSTTTPKFGTASLSLSGATTASLMTPSNALFNALGTNAFVVDMWATTSTTPGTDAGLSAIGSSAGPGSSVSFAVSETSSGTVSANLFSGSSTVYTAISAGTITNGSPHHVALVATGTTVYIALDGIVSSGVSYSGLNSTTNKLAIGAYGEFSGSGRQFTGNIDEFRITVGSTRGWTTNFPVLTTPYC